MPWVEISHAAFMMGISERTIRNWIKSGKLNARTENGRRMVEVPAEALNSSDAGGAGEGAHFQDDSSFDEKSDNDNADETAIGPQKRLEIALLECGRVKGTLASQERIMETLSSNIAELTAKLQRSQNLTSRWVMACIVCAMLAVIAYFASTSYYHQELNTNNADYSKRIDQLKEKNEDSFRDMQKEKTESLEAMRNSVEKTVMDRIKDIAASYDKTNAEIKATYERIALEYKEEQAKMEARLKDQNIQYETSRTQMLDLSRELQIIKEEKGQLQIKLESQARLLEEMDKLKQQYRELESELIEERRKNRGIDKRQ